MNRIYGIFTSVLIALLIAKSSFAYDPSHHQELTKLAAMLLAGLKIERCDGAQVKESPLITPQEIDRVALSTKKEDIDPRRAPDRLSFWHFFSSKYYPSSYVFDAQRENPHGKVFDYVADVLIKRIQDNINDMITKGEQAEFGLKDITKYGVKNRDELFFERLGRGVHFIQDATVPAHVVPVYHGPWLPQFGAGLPMGAPIHDPIDSFPIKAGVEKGLLVPGSLTSSTLLEDIIKRNIATTLEDLATPIKQGSYHDLTWGYFFQKPQGTKFFGAYTITASKKRAFDPKTFDAHVQVENPLETLKVSQTLVDAFAQKLHQRAIVSTAQYMRAEITRYFAKKCQGH